MPVINPNTGNGNGGTGANTHAVPANYAQSLATQIAQMNARQSSQAAPSGGISGSGGSGVSSSAPSYAATSAAVAAPSQAAATTAYANANTPAAQSYIALAKAYGIPISQQAINNANSTTNPSNFGVYGGYGQSAAAPAPTAPPGSGAPAVSYQAFGSAAKVSFQDPHGTAFTATVSLPNGNTFIYNGNVSGVPLGSINAQDQAVEQAWSAYQAAQQSLQNIPAGSSMTVNQGPNGLNLNINTAAGTSLPTQTVTIAPGLTFTGPTSAAATEAAAQLLTSGFMSSLDPSKTYVSDNIPFKGSQLQNMYTGYESQISTALTSENPTVTVEDTTASFNSLTPAQQQQYVQQQVDQYLQNLQYNGSGYYNINGKNTYISNPSYYTALLGNGVIGQYEGTTAPQAPVTTPTFTTNAGSPTIMLPQAWSTDSNGNLYVNGQAPTLQQSIQYANAYAQYLSWYQSANPPSTASAQNTQSAPPPVPNWYTEIFQSQASGAPRTTETWDEYNSGLATGSLASLQYTPIAATAQFNEYAASLGLTPAALAAMMQQQQSPQPSLSQQIASVYGINPRQAYSILGPINPPQAQLLSSNAFTLSQPSNVSAPLAFPAPTAVGNTPIALSMLGTGGLSLSPQYSATEPTSVQALSLPTPQQSGTNTNTTQSSSWTSNPLTNIYNVLAPIPGDVASTFGSLISPITTMLYPGMPGGAPLAGGQFPYNYPYSQSGINKLALTSPSVAQAIQNQLNQLEYLHSHALPMTMPNAGYQYLGSPSPTGPLFPNINPSALQYYTPQQLNALQANYNLAALEALGATSAAAAATVAPLAVAQSALAGAGIGGALNPGITYVLTGGQATPQQLAQSSAQGLVYGGAMGAAMPGINYLAGIDSESSLLARALLGAGTNLGFTNAYSMVANGTPAPLSSDLLAAGLGAGLPVVGDTLGWLKYQLSPGYLRPTDILSTEDIYGQRPTIYEYNYPTPTQETAVSNQYGLNSPLDYLRSNNPSTDVNGFPLQAPSETPYSVTLPDGSTVMLDFPTSESRVLTPRVSYTLGETGPSTDYMQLYNDLAAAGKQLQQQALGEPSYTEKVPLLTSLRDIQPQEIPINTRTGDIFNVQTFGSQTPRPILQSVPDYRAAAIQFLKAALIGDPFGYPTEMPMKEVPIGTYQAFYNSPEGQAMRMISGTTSGEGSLVPGSENTYLSQGYGTLPESPLEYSQYALYNTLLNRLRAAIGLEPIPVRIGGGISTASGENTQVGNSDIVQFQRGVTPVAGQPNIEYRQNIDLPSKQTIPLTLVENPAPGTTAFSGEIFTPYSDTGVPITKFIGSSLDNPYARFIASGMQGPIAGSSYLPDLGLNSLPDLFDLQGRGINVQAPSASAPKPFALPEQSEISQIEYFTPQQYLQDEIRSGLASTFAEPQAQSQPVATYQQQGYNVPGTPSNFENPYPLTTPESIANLKSILLNNPSSAGLLLPPGVPEEILSLPSVTAKPSVSTSVPVLSVSPVSQSSTPRIGTVTQPSTTAVPSTAPVALITSPIPTSTLINDVSTSISNALKTNTSLPLQEINNIATNLAYNLEPKVANAINQSLNESQSHGLSNNLAENLATALNESLGMALNETLAEDLGQQLAQQLAVQLAQQLALILTLQLVEVLPPPLNLPLVIPNGTYFSPQDSRKFINPYEAYASIYSPSLLPEVMPGLERLAEQEYSPMTALSTIRPLRAPSVNTPITLPSYAAPAQPTIEEENLPGASNYYKAQSTPMAHIVSGPSPTAATSAATATPSYSFNEPFSNATAATQVAPITDPAVLQAVSTAANPVNFGTLPASAPPSSFSTIANPMLQSLNRLNLNALRLPNTLSSQATAMAAISPNAAQPSGAAFGSAGYSAPKIGNISLIPTSQDIMSVLGPDQMLRMLNQINPTKFSVTNIKYAPKAALAAALNNLSYSDIVLLMSEMSVPQRMMVYGLLGIPPGEALIIAESGTQGLFIPSLSNALAATTRKRIAVPAPAQLQGAPQGQPMPAPAPMPTHINPPMPNVNRQLVTI